MINERFNLNELLFFFVSISFFFYFILFYDVSLTSKFMNIMISVYDFHFVFHCWRFFFLIMKRNKTQHQQQQNTNPCLIVKNIIITYKGITLNTTKKKPKKKYVGIRTKWVKNRFVYISVYNENINLWLAVEIERRWEIDINGTNGLEKGKNGF